MIMPKGVNLHEHGALSIKGSLICEINSLKSIRVRTFPLDFVLDKRQLYGRNKGVNILLKSSLTKSLNHYNLVIVSLLTPK